MYMYIHVPLGTFFSRAINFASGKLAGMKFAILLKKARFLDN